MGFVTRMLRRAGGTLTEMLRQSARTLALVTIKLCLLLLVYVILQHYIDTLGAVALLAVIVLAQLPGGGRRMTATEMGGAQMQRDRQE